MSKFRALTRDVGAGSVVEVVDAQGNRIADVCDMPTARTIATALSGIDARTVGSLEAETERLQWVVMRQNVALRMVRHYAMSGLAMPGSMDAMIWLKGWIDAGLDTPLPWPAGLEVGALLGSWGYANIAGLVGLSVPMDRAKSVGEVSAPIVTESMKAFFAMPENQRAYLDNAFADGSQDEIDDALRAVAAARGLVLVGAE